MGAVLDSTIGILCITAFVTISELNLPLTNKIDFVVSRTAPTHLGVQTAHKHGLTLIGFARGKKMNLYTHSGRIDV